jgi:hypothetical protein
VEAPELDLVVRPLGSASFVADMGFVVTLVRDLLAKLLTKQLTEPVRRVLDIHRMYLEKHIARVRHYCLGKGREGVFFLGGGCAVRVVR